MEVHLLSWQAWGTRSCNPFFPSSSFFPSPYYLRSKASSFFIMRRGGTRQTWKEKRRGRNEHLTHSHTGTVRPTHRQSDKRMSGIKKGQRRAKRNGGGRRKREKEGNSAGEGHYRPTWKKGMRRRKLYNCGAACRLIP